MAKVTTKPVDVAKALSNDGDANKPGAINSKGVSYKVADNAAEWKRGPQGKG